MAGNNEENVAHVTVDIGLSLEDGTDPSDVAKCLEKLFAVGEKFGELLHNERLTVGEALFVIYMLEKGALSTMNVGDPEDISHLLLKDNKVKMDMIANMVVKNKLEKDEKEKNEQKNLWSEITKY